MVVFGIKFSFYHAYVFSTNQILPLELVICEQKPNPIKNLLWQ